jgi:hypothetical protein
MCASKYVPTGYSETDDFFAGVMVDAPEFSADGMSIDDAFNKLQMGIGSVIERTRNARAVDILQKCKEELVAVQEMFESNIDADAEVRKAARKRLQRAYYDLYRKVGGLLKPGAEIGPDDDV